MINKLLEIAYKREVELEDHIERNLKSDMTWFLQDTRDLNIAIQSACLEKKNKIRLVGQTGVRLQ